MQPEEFGEFVESMIITRGFDITELEPLCSFDVKLKNIPEELQKIRPVITTTPTELNPKNVDDILKIIEYLLNRPYTRFVQYIHIVDFDRDDENYYCKITNMDFDSQNDNTLIDMYLLYKPKIWDKLRAELSVKKVSFWRRLVSVIPFSLVWTRETSSSKTSFELSTPSNRNSFISLLDFATVINCFAYSLLSVLKEKTSSGAVSSALVTSPLRTCANVIFKSFGYSICGLLLSNLVPPTSNVVFNSIFGYAVYSLYNQKR